MGKCQHLQHGAWGIHHVYLKLFEELRDVGGYKGVDQMSDVGSPVTLSFGAHQILSIQS